MTNVLMTLNDAMRQAVLLADTSLSAPSSCPTMMPVEFPMDRNTSLKICDIVPLMFIAAMTAMPLTEYACKRLAWARLQRNSFIRSGKDLDKMNPDLQGGNVTNYRLKVSVQWTGRDEHSQSVEVALVPASAIMWENGRGGALLSDHGVCFSTYGDAGCAQYTYYRQTDK